MEVQGAAIPVVMYHTVGRTMPDWNWSFLTVPFKVFENQLKWLVKAGYTTIDLDELHAHVSGDQILAKPAVVLTFDDGYLDTWTHVAPLLSRYGLKATVFVNPDFVDPRDIVRPTLHDVWAGTCTERDLEVRGFMSWPELRQLTEQGPICVQSHAMTHTWYPVGDKIIDFHHPGDDYYWLDWNRYPERKPFYLLDPQKSAVAWGTPVYEHAKSLQSPRFFPDPREAEHLVALVEQLGGEKFFRQSDWRQILYDEVQEHRRNGADTGRRETEEECIERYRYELGEAKRIIEKQLGVVTDFLCWPGGGYDECAREMALTIYKGVTLASSDPSPVQNRPGDNAAFIRRFGVPIIEYRGGIRYPGGRYLVRFLDEYRHVPLARFRRRVLKALFLSFSFFREVPR